MKNKFDNDVKQFITDASDGVELEGPCPICGTGRSQYGECWRGHIVINVNNSATVEALRQSVAQHNAQRIANTACKKHDIDFCAECFPTTSRI